jgi:hypothetical protein
MAAMMGGYVSQQAVCCEATNDNCRWRQLLKGRDQFGHGSAVEH